MLTRNILTDRKTSVNRNTPTSRKAQILTYDFFTAMAIFFVVLIVVMGYWYYSSVQIEETRERNQATNLLYLSSDIWFKEGYPKHWEATDVMEIGMSNDNRINETKMDILNNSISYSKLVSLLNLGTYNVQYTFTHLPFTFFIIFKSSIQKFSPLPMFCA